MVPHPSSSHRRSYRFTITPSWRHCTDETVHIHGKHCNKFIGCYCASMLSFYVAHRSKPAERRSSTGHDQKRWLHLACFIELVYINAHCRPVSVLSSRSAPKFRPAASFKGAFLRIVCHVTRSESLCINTGRKSSS